MILQITQSDGGSKAVRFFLAQHMPDLLRKETTNVGILVQRGDEVTTRFIGERESGDKLDGRLLKHLSDPKLYRNWVHFWKKAIKKADWENRLLHDDRQTYTFIQGGEVTDTGTDSLDAICNYLFHLLVADGGMKKALVLDEHADIDHDIPVRDELRSELRKLRIMWSQADKAVKHPVFENRSVEGNKGLWHEMSFLQETGDQLWAFEPLNLSSPQKSKIKERAGYLGYVFRDLQEAASSGTKGVVTSAIISLNLEDEKLEHVQYALSLIQPHAEIFNMRSDQERSHFLRIREQIAYAA